MSVQETTHDGEWYSNDTTVLWGNYEDTICFKFNSKLKCYYNVSKDTWSNHPRKLKLKSLHAAESSKPKDLFYVRQDEYNELYSIRFVSASDGIIIFVTNIVYGTPNYTFIYCPSLRR